MGTSPPYISALCDSRRPEVDVDIYQAHPVCRSFRAGPSPVLNIGASTGLKYRRPSFLSVESWYLISLPLLPIDMNNQFRPPGNAGFESWRRRQEPISPHRAPSAAEQLLHQVQVNSQPWWYTARLPGGERETQKRVTIRYQSTPAPNR